MASPAGVRLLSLLLVAAPLLAAGCLPFPSKPSSPPPVKPAPTPVQLSAPRPDPVHVAPAVPRTEGEYYLPNQAVRELLTSPPPPVASLHPNAGWMMLAHHTALVPLARLARPSVRLAALYIDEETYSPPNEPRITRVELIALEESPGGLPPERHTIVPPEGTELATPLLSHDGKFLAAIALDDETSRVAVYSLERGEWALGDGPIQHAFQTPCRWSRAGKLFCVFVPNIERRLPEPVYGPSILEHFGGPMRVRMRSDLLKGIGDEQLFDYYFTGELRQIDPSASFEPDADVEPDPGASSESDEKSADLGELARTEAIPSLESTPVGPRGIISDFSISPNGEYLHVVTLQRPYSHVTGWDFFPREETLWHVKKPKAVLKLLLRKGSELTFLGDPLGRRATRWHPFEPATMTWLDRAERNGKTSDRWLAQAMPPHENAVRTFKTAPRIEDRGFTTAGTPWVIVPGESWRALEGRHPDLPAGIECGSAKAPFAEALRSDSPESLPLELDGRLWVSSERLTRGGSPILEAVDLGSGNRTTLFKSAPDHYERVIGIVNQDTWVTVRETASLAPHYFLMRKGQTALPLTTPENPYPTMAGVERRLVRYIRDDGLELSAHMYLPPGYRPGKRLPTVVWIYPTEYTEEGYANYSAEATRHRFTTISGPSRLALVLAGYAVLDNPTMPIVGDRGQANDNYLNHLEMSAEAAVRFLVEEGYSAPGRIAVAGRSYGAFSAANLLAHTDLFATAIALSGAYNRTLTPFGFQNERRSFWAQSDLYARISPFFSASQIDEPLLLIHGQNDENPGTPLMQSERMFHAVVGIGGQTRLVVLPLEGHQLRGEESVLHTTYEMISWLDRHLVPPAPRAARPGAKTQPKR